jgi:hypothetical protein
LDEDNPHSQPHPQIENEASKKVQGIVQGLSFQTRLFAPDSMREKSIAPTMCNFRTSKVKVVRRPSVEDLYSPASACQAVPVGTTIGQIPATNLV